MMLAVALDIRRHRRRRAAAASAAAATAAAHADLRVQLPHLLLELLARVALRARHQQAAGKLTPRSFCPASVAASPNRRSIVRRHHVVGGLLRQHDHASCRSASFER